MTTKDTVVSVVQKLPHDASPNMIREEVENILAILESEEDVQAGRVYSHEQVMEEMRNSFPNIVGRSRPVSN